MKKIRYLNIPNTFDSDDLRLRRILNIVLLFLAVISFVALASGFMYGDPVLEVLSNKDSQPIILGSVVMLIVCVGLMGLNRSTSAPKGVVGWILVIVMIAVVAFSDHPYELANGRSLIFWFLPILLSVIVLPPASVFIVDVVVFAVIAAYSESLKEVNIFAMFVIAGASLLAWLGMSIANRAIRDARNEAEKNRAILNGVADGVVVLNADDQVVLANPAALNMMGSAIASFASTTDEERKEIGGRVLSFHWSDVHGVGNVAIVRDISRQAEVERAKDAILGVVSHEMRTPLAAILGFAEVLARTSSSPEIAERIHVNAQRMIALVDDLLDHAQIQAGTLKMSQERFSPFTLANTVRDLLAARAEEKGVSLNIAVSDMLPKNLMGDPQRLQQIFINLIWNAIKFTNTGGHVEVLLSLNGDDTNIWRMVVSDTGIGIPPERLPDIFEPFRRASDYATRSHQGAGLGLSISKKIAQLLGGDIQVTSMVGQGSVFTVTLPLRRPDGSSFAHRVEGEIPE